MNLTESDSMNVYDVWEFPHPSECVLTSFPVLIAKDRGSLVQVYDIRGRHELDLSYYVAMCVGNLWCNTTQRMKLSV